MSPVTIRAMTPDDYAAVRTLWESTEGVGLSGADSAAGVARFLVRNPGLSRVALQGSAVVGAVLCGHDGRRGYLQHLAVHAAWRRRGIGQALVERCLSDLADEGIAKCHILVFADNRTGRAFWSHRGWIDRVELRVMSRELPAA